ANVAERPGIAQSVGEGESCGRYSSVCPAATEVRPPGERLRLLQRGTAAEARRGASAFAYRRGRLGRQPERPESWQGEILGIRQVADGIVPVAVPEIDLSRRVPHAIGAEDDFTG